jgi:hypothetical protein
MANNILKTRIVLCNDTSVAWASSEKVLLKGEMAIELSDSSTPKIKIGDGTNKFSALPYAILTPEEVASKIKVAVNTASHTHSNKAILDAITASFTTQLKANYDAAYKHSTSAHAPSNAQANVIEGVSVNGTKLTPNSKVVDVTVPTKVSQLQNDTGFITSYKDTKYTLGAPSGAANGNATIDITDSDKNKQSLKISGAGATKVTTDSSGNIVITSTDNNTVYSHPTSGVTAGTYKSVTVDNKGHVTAGTNPTTLSGYGITDTYTGAQIDSKISSAVANADHLKRTIVNALPSVDAADEHTIYMVPKASGAVGSGTNNGYDEYMLIVSGSTKKFEKIGDSAVDLTNYATKAYADQSEADALSAAKTYANGLAKNYATAAQGIKADSAVQSVKIGTKEYKSGTTVTLPAYPTTLPASDVYAWAKASSKPSYSKSEVGLGNVDNTADSAKSVKYATSAGSASSASKATGLVDYNATRQTIQIGYGGSGISGDAIKFIAGYTTGNGSDVNAKIKDVSKDALKSWLGLGSLAYSSATIPTIPSSLPANGGNSTTVNGHTVNSNVPANAKFTDTWRGVQNNLTSTATDQSLSAYQGKVLKDLVDKKTTFTYSSTQPTSPASNAVWIG